MPRDHIMKRKRWPMPRNALFSHYCCHCIHWAHIRDVGCAHLGECRAIPNGPTEQDAYDKPCALWREDRARPVGTP